MGARPRRPDIGTVDVLCLMHLAARRRGCTVRLVSVSPELRDLIVFAGLAEVLVGEDAASGEPGRRRPGPS